MFGSRNLLDLDKRFIIGIDLGTTNSAVSFVDLQSTVSKKRKISLFKVPQLTGAGEISRLLVLPSFYYIPGKYDISKEAIHIPWQKTSNLFIDPKSFVGAFARDHGVKVPARLVSSAKSWLCHQNVDRRSRILPWGAGDEVAKVSPVEAAAAYLGHIKDAWNSTRGDDEDAYLENQIIIVTVPASFDEVARDLTVEAASLCGLKNVTLLEEPLAAFYSWLIRHESDWHQHVSTGQLILVCDVGGGTTDFTLITLKEVDGNPRFERIAVGDHLILGGDNIDLALARRLEIQLGREQKSLGGDRWKALCHQCRQAKEIILNGDKEQCKITLMGEGSRLIADTMSSDLSKKDVEKTILEGFFPIADRKAFKERPLKAGISEFGLPYEQEPAITRHLGWFIDRHRDEIQNGLNRKNPSPDFILFNGGSLKPKLIQDRIREGIKHWFKDDGGKLPDILENSNPDLSVALGASYYGLVKIGKGVRVGSGSARSYYLGVSKNKGDSVSSETKHAVCLVERGLEEGSLIELKDKKFEVLANQPVVFDIYSSSYRSGDRCGDIVVLDDSLTALPPVQTTVQFGKKGKKTLIPIRIEAAYTEMGTMALWCRSLVSSHKWQLQFQLRNIEAALDVADQEIFDESLVTYAKNFVKESFQQKSDVGQLQGLVKTLAKTFERPKEKWPLSVIRSIADELIVMGKAREISAPHESRWLNLTGFCLRPGFGEGFDSQRIKHIWKLHKDGLKFPKSVQNRSEWWIFWRRIAGGLKPGQQRQFIQELTPSMFGKKSAKPKFHPQEAIEIWMAVANMELLQVNDKIRWAKQLLSEINPNKCLPQQLWALSRLCARALLYAPADRVIPPQEVSDWIERMLSKSWRNPKPVGIAMAQMARKTGDRARDVDHHLIEKIKTWMNAYDFFTPHLKYLDKVVGLEKQEESTIFGESLPSGLVLHVDDAS
jgi:molecular chaperone DnaK (HSP70)